jgi:hypothetical protein
MEEMSVECLLDHASDAAHNLLLEYGRDVKKHDVRLRLMLNYRTRVLPEYEREHIVDKVWREIKKALFSSEKDRIERKG